MESFCYDVMQKLSKIYWKIIDSGKYNDENMIIQWMQISKRKTSA